MRQGRVGCSESLRCTFPAPGSAQTRYIRCVRELGLRCARTKRGFFCGQAWLALGLRLLLVLRFPGVVDDSRLYANIAENWLQHGIYGVTDSGVIMPTLSRLPGYPAFLAAIFRRVRDREFSRSAAGAGALRPGNVFPDRGYGAASVFRAGGAGGVSSGRPLSVSGQLCRGSVDRDAGDFLHRVGAGLGLLRLGSWRKFGECPSPTPRLSPGLAWLGCGLSVGAAILLRPDGGILLAAIGTHICSGCLCAACETDRSHARALDWAGVLVAAGALAPLVPWTLRNLHTLHRFQPLAPRYATDSDELAMPASIAG